MLNEAVDFQYMNILIVVITILFLAVCWGGFYFFVKFKKRDDARRQSFRDYHEKN